MYEEVNTKCNLPAQIDIEATGGAWNTTSSASVKGGGSANKSYLYQETKAVLNPAKLVPYLIEKMKSLGTAACPPYHIAFVIGGTSAERTMLTVKLASCHYYDGLADHGRRNRPRLPRRRARTAAPRRSLEDRPRRPVRRQVVRLWTCALSGCPATAPPARLAWESPALRTATSKAKITPEASVLNSWTTNPGQYIPEALRMTSSEAVSIDLNRPMKEVLERTGASTPSPRACSLNGTIIVARDIAHAKLKERLEKGEGLPRVYEGSPRVLRRPGQNS